MQEIVLCRLEKWIEEKGEETMHEENAHKETVHGETAHEEAAYEEAVHDENVQEESVHETSSMKMRQAGEQEQGVRRNEARKNGRPCIIAGEPCVRLRELQSMGYCVLAELRHLQGLSEDEVAEALCKEEAVQQYENVCINAADLPQGYLRRIWCKAHGRPMVIAETERLIVRESVEADAAAFLELYQDEECRKYLELPPVDAGETLKAYRRYITDYRNGQYAFYEFGMWTVVEKVSGAVVGRAGLEQQEMIPGLGYAILPQFRGRGYAVEACQAILEYCKECEYADKVYVKVDARNVASRKVFENLKERSCVPLVLCRKRLPGRGERH